jgi:hypothetical protein
MLEGLSVKKFITALAVLSSTSAFAAEPQLLQNALSCKLKDSDMPSLIRTLAAQQPAFAKPAKQFGAPSADVYQLQAPVTALGYSSREVVVTPGRILLAVPGETIAKAAGKLKLKEEEYSPASREVRPTVSVVAFQLSHMADKLLVGCQYANNDAASWVQQ